ncbi:putative oxidoreductase [Nymphon striatum]|nr:putative oxidoreductase [Nymphon striatum]
MNMLPKGTHEYSKFIRPSELESWARKAGLHLENIKGMTYNPLLQSYKLGTDVDINYLMHFNNKVKSIQLATVFVSILLLSACSSVQFKDVHVDKKGSTVVKAIDSADNQKIDSLYNAIMTLGSNIEPSEAQFVAREAVLYPKVQLVTMSSRSFLFLQGVASPFFTELGKSLVEAGHEVSRINFCGGDYFFSKPFINKQISHINYRGSLESLHQFLETLLTEKSFSDIVLFGDTRPIHQAAIDLARQKNIDIHVFEEGYIRPYWITLDKEGWYKDFSSSNTVSEPLETGKQMRPRAWHDIRYHLSGLLVIKNHPLDTGLIDYPDKINETLSKHKIDKKRIIYLETGDLNALLEHAKGTVLVNSTVGMSALAINCPTITLGSAIYDIPGLTYQGKLDDFWIDALKPEGKPDDSLFNDFRSALITLNQINGDFYTKKGIEMAIQGSMRVLNREYSHSSNQTLDTPQTANDNISEPKPSNKLHDYKNYKCETKGAEVLCHSIDVCDTEKLQHTIQVEDEKHPINMVIANAGVTSHIGDNGEAESWDAICNIINTNLYGVLATLNPLLSRMQSRKHGQIAIVSSLGAYRGMPITPSYCASKAAVKSYGEALRGWLKDDGIKVSVICPGFVKSELSSQFPGNKPMMISADKAADIIYKGLRKNKANISFPFPLNLGMWFLAILPSSLSDWFMKLFSYGAKR